MDTKGLELATFMFGVLGLILGIPSANAGFLIAGSILIGSSLVALRMGKR